MCCLVMILLLSLDNDGVRAPQTSNYNRTTYITTLYRHYNVLECSDSCARGVRSKVATSLPPSELANEAHESFWEVDPSARARGPSRCW